MRGYGEDYLDIGLPPQYFEKNSIERCVMVDPDLEDLGREVLED